MSISDKEIENILKIIIYVKILINLLKIKI